MGVCANAMVGVGFLIDLDDYISDIPINGKGSPKAGKLVMDSATFGLSREIGNASFLGGKEKIAGQVATGMFGFMANGWADKAAKDEGGKNE